MDGRPKRIKKFAFTSVCVYNRLRVDGAKDFHLFVLFENKNKIKFAKRREYLIISHLFILNAAKLASSSGKDSKVF